MVDRTSRRPILALLYTWPPTLFTVLILNLCVLVRLSYGKTGSFRSEMFSSFAGSLPRSLLAVIFLQMFLPCVPGSIPVTCKAFRDFDGHLFWLKNVGTLFLTGSLWTRSGQAVTPYMEYLPIAEANPIPFYLAVVIAAYSLLWVSFACVPSNLRGAGLSPS